MNIQETDVWQENIYLIGDNDPVQGGENGVDNLPHKQLASRTLFLKNKVDKLEAKVDGLSSTIDKLQQPEDTLGLQKQIDVLKEQIAEIVKNGGTKNPIAAFDINLSTHYSDNDAPKPWAMSVSAQTTFGGFVPVVEGTRSLGAYRDATVTIPDWVTESSQVVMTITGKVVDNAENYITLDISSHRINIEQAHNSIGLNGQGTLHPAGRINVTLYR